MNWLNTFPYQHNAITNTTIISTKTKVSNNEQFQMIFLIINMKMKSYYVVNIIFKYHYQ